jgi:hypothetical protein
MIVGTILTKSFYLLMMAAPNLSRLLLLFPHIASTLICTLTLDLLIISRLESASDNEHIHATNGKGVNITYVGTSIFHTSHCDLSFNKLLHVPQSIKNLNYVH